MPLSLKILGAILLLSSLAFPPKYWVDSGGHLHPQSWRTPIGEAGDEPADSGGYAHPVYLVIRYALGLGQEEDDTDLMYEQSPWVNRLMVLAFSWPVIAIAFTQWRKQKIGVGPRILEIVCLVGTFILVCALSTFAIMKETRIGPGGYLAFLALGLYATGALWQWRQSGTKGGRGSHFRSNRAEPVAPAGRPRE
jgi:hypothetical protein